MKNNLATVIIDNPQYKGWGYRVRDTFIMLTTLALWGLLMVQVISFVAEEGALVEQVCALQIFRVVAVGFVVTFLTFHLWAIYNRHLYRRSLKWQYFNYMQGVGSVAEEDVNEAIQ